MLERISKWAHVSYVFNVKEENDGRPDPDGHRAFRRELARTGAPMTELVHERVLELRDGQGTAYRRVLVYAERQPAGTWVAWVEFVSANGDKVLQTDRETTQSSLNGIAYWATGLHRAYFEGALDRAYRRMADLGASSAATSPASASGMVSFRVRSTDAHLPLRLMSTHTLVPGGRRQVREGGIVYVRAVEPALTDMPRIYEFLAHFRTETAAAVLASCLESELLETGAILEIRGTEVPIEGAAIRDALLAGTAIRPSPTKRHR